MWINNIDSKRKKLKSDAIPTIFGFFIKKQNTENEISNIQNNKCPNDKTCNEMESVKVGTVHMDNTEPPISDNLSLSDVRKKMNYFIITE